jgi:hypothetical protein
MPSCRKMPPDSRSCRRVLEGFGIAQPFAKRRRAQPRREDARHSEVAEQLRQQRKVGVHHEKEPFRLVRAFDVDARLARPLLQRLQLAPSERLAVIDGLAEKDLPLAEQVVHHRVRRIAVCVGLERGGQPVVQGAQDCLRAQLLDAEVAREVLRGKRNARRGAGKPNEQALERLLRRGHRVFHSEVAVAVAHEDKVAAVEDDPCKAREFVPLLFRKVGEILFQLRDGDLWFAMFQLSPSLPGCLYSMISRLNTASARPRASVYSVLGRRVDSRCATETFQQVVHLATEVALVGRSWQDFLKRVV